MTTFKNSALAILVITLCLTTLLCHSVQGSVADELWNKYRVKVIEMLQGRFGAYHTGLSHFGSNTNVDQTVLHIVTDPMDADWHTGIAELGEFAGFVPSWRTSWETRMTSDNTVEAKYKSLIFSMANKNLAAQQFVKFNAAPKGFEESPHHERLGAFIARTQGAPANAFHFAVEEGSGSTSIGGPWGTKTSTFSSMSSIVRELNKAGGAVMWDGVPLHDNANDADIDLDMGDEDVVSLMENEPQAASGLFGRRRRRSAPVVQQPITIASKKFHMDMKASGLIGIPVRSQVIDRNFIRQYRAHFQGNWFGAGGQFGLVPSIVWVAMRPHVVLRLSESEFHIVQQSWGRSLGLAAGGVFFRNNNFRQTVLDDATNEVLGSMFSEETLNTMRENKDLQDTASFVIKSTNEMGEEMVLQEGLLEDFQEDLLRDTAEFSVKEDDDDILASQLDQEEEGLFEDLDAHLADAQLFGRRRRRRSDPPPPPPPPVIHEKVYEAVFQSNSHLPQVIAITSDIL